MERQVYPVRIDGQWRYYPIYRRSHSAEWQYYKDPRKKNALLWFATKGAAQLFIEHDYIRTAVRSGLRNERGSQQA